MPQLVLSPSSPRPTTKRLPMRAATMSMTSRTASDGTNSTTKAVAITVTNVNEAPTITSGATASFAENASGTVYTAAATDPDAGATLTYSISGADAALFDINATTGAITFKSSPDYEAPADAGGDNVYDVTVRRPMAPMSHPTPLPSPSPTSMKRQPLHRLQRQTLPRMAPEPFIPLPQRTRMPERR